MYSPVPMATASCRLLSHHRYLFRFLPQLTVPDLPAAPRRQQDGPQQGRHGFGFHMRLSFRLLGSGYHSLSRVSSIIYRNSNNNFCLYEFCNFLLHFGGGGYILSTGNNRIAVFGAGRNSPPAVIVCERLRPQEPAQFRYRQYSLDERRRVRHCHNALF